MVYSVEIINDDGVKFRFQEAECKTLTIRKSKRSVKQDLPNDDGGGTIVINLGTQETLTFPFVLRSTDTDASGDSYPSAEIKTVQNKVDFLRDVLLKTGIEDFYTINIYSVAEITGLKASLEDFSLDFSADKPNTLRGSASFVIGGGNQS